MTSGEIFSIFILCSSFGFLIGMSIINIFVDVESDKDSGNLRVLSKKILRFLVKFSALLGIASVFVLLIAERSYPSTQWIQTVHDRVFDAGVAQGISAFILGVFCRYWFFRAQEHQAYIRTLRRRIFDPTSQNAASSIDDISYGDAPLASGKRIDQLPDAAYAWLFGSGNKKWHEAFTANAHHLGYGTIAVFLLLAALLGKPIITLIDRMTALSTSFVEAQFANIKLSQDFFFEADRQGRTLRALGYLRSLDQFVKQQHIWSIAQHQLNGKHATEQASDSIWVKRYDYLLRSAHKIGNCAIGFINEGMHADDVKFHFHDVIMDINFYMKEEKIYNELMINDTYEQKIWTDIDKRISKNCRHHDRHDADFNSFRHHFDEASWPMFGYFAHVALNAFDDNLEWIHQSLKEKENTYESSEFLMTNIARFEHLVQKNYRSSDKYYRKLIKLYQQKIDHIESILDSDISNISDQFDGDDFKIKDELDSLVENYEASIWSSKEDRLMTMTQGLAEGDEYAISMIPSIEAEAASITEYLQEERSLEDPMWNAVAYSRLMIEGRREFKDKKAMRRSVAILKRSLAQVELELSSEEESDTVFQKRRTRAYREQISTYLDHAKILMQH